MKLPAFLIPFVLVTAAHAADLPLLSDDFTAPRLEQRNAQRGDWKIAGGMATCTQDDALFKKNKDHGPIIFYKLSYTDATIRFRYKGDAVVKTFVFTANSPEGHVFRFVATPTGTGIRAFPTDSKGHESISLGQEKSLALKAGEWVPVTVTLRGPMATVKIGDFEKSYQHASLARAKSNLSLGFSYGTLAVKDVVVEK